MQFTKATLAVLTSALAASATNVHNQYGENGWIEDSVGTVIELDYLASASIGGGDGFFWVSPAVCNNDSVYFTWPSTYKVSYLCIDWKQA
jgi:hypothetical protein